MGVSKDRAERWRRILLGLGVFSILWNMGEAGAGLYFVRTETGKGWQRT